MRRPTQAVLAALAVGLVTVGCSGGDDGASPREPTRYVALGDSFSAGEGAREYDVQSGSCRRSTKAWPAVLDQREDDLELVDLRACGGATTQRLLEPWTARGEPAQSPDDPDPSVGLVTLTVGGNDVGFGEIVLRCVILDCGSVPGSDDYTRALAELTTELATRVYPDLGRAYPEARIVHVGYPRLTPAEGEPVEGCFWLRGDEPAAAAEIVALLDRAIADAVAAADATIDVHYLDVTDAFSGHELCSDGESWVNDVISLDAERAHPTVDGHRALAEAVARGLERGA